MLVMEGAQVPKAPRTKGTKMYSHNKPRPKSGYQCKICGKEGGKEDSHWFQLCPFKGQQNESSTYIPPKQGYVCKYCNKPGGEKGSHWFQQCPLYKKKYSHHNSYSNNSDDSRLSSQQNQLQGVPGPYNNGVYHPGIPLASSYAANLYQQIPGGISSNGLMVHYSQYPQGALQGGQMYYMRQSVPAASTGERLGETGMYPSPIYNTQMAEYFNHAYGYPGVDESDRSKDALAGREFATHGLNENKHNENTQDERKEELQQSIDHLKALSLSTDKKSSQAELHIEPSR